MTKFCGTWGIVAPLKLSHTHDSWMVEPSELPKTLLTPWRLEVKLGMEDHTEATRLFVCCSNQGNV